MKMFLFLLFLLSYFGSSVALNCTKIPQNQQVAGASFRIPDNSQDLVVIPPNFNCIYSIIPPPMVFAQVGIKAQMLGPNDSITVRDQLGKFTVINSRTPSLTSYFSVYPGVITTIQVTTKSVQMNSKYLLLIEFVKMPDPVTVALAKGTNAMNYALLNDISVPGNFRPKSYVSDEVITVISAPSNIPGENFDDYYIVDGDFHYPSQVVRLSNFEFGDFVSTTHTVTLVGLNIDTSQSSVTLLPLSETKRFNFLEAVTVYNDMPGLRNTTVFINGMHESATMVVSKDGNPVVLTGVEFTTLTPNCIAKAVSGPPNSASQTLLDLTPGAHLPNTINQRYFSFIVQNCAVNINVAPAFMVK